MQSLFYSAYRIHRARMQQSEMADMGIGAFISFSAYCNNLLPTTSKTVWYM